MRYLILSIFILVFGNPIYSQDTTLENNIKSLIKGKKATVGVSVIYDSKEALKINDHYRYPTMSVYKFHLALAVLDHLYKNKISLDSKILIKKSDLLPNTYSPLREKHPNGNIKLSIAELLEYSVSKSDNNACDILFRYLGGTKPVEKYIKSLGIEDITITATEEVMHQNHENQYLNWSTPYSTVQLLGMFLQEDLFGKEYRDFLKKIMVETTTGKDKIKGLLPENIIVGHKTGSSFRNEFGIKIAENDMGFVTLPNGKQYSVAIFVINSMEDDKTNSLIIAEISKAIYDYYIHK
ncbi:MAG: class A beta-lactamase, subclass A2 [Dysgonomonas sp.]|nr:class A beta-lactamase, subclass A2 [Dysgonomonas sp.]